MKKMYVLLLLFSFVLGIAQNTEIKDDTGVLLPPTYNFCSGSNINLQVDDYASSAGSSSGETTFSDFSLYTASTLGETDVTFSAATLIRDKFSYPIDLGFNFTFFNKTYTRLVVGSNGRLVFSNDPILDNLHDTSTFIDRPFLSAPVQIASPKYNQIYRTGDVTREVNMAQIFAGFTNLRINAATGKYIFKRFDIAGNKGILIKFQSVIAHDNFGGDYGPAFTSQVIIFEDGRVILNVSGKNSASLAILGMQNEEGDIAIVPIHDDGYNYNNDMWPSENPNAFVITTGLVRTPSYLWELDRDNDGTVDQTSATRFFPNYSPISDVEKLSIRISFAETAEVKTGQVIFKKILTPVIVGVLDCAYDMRVTDETYDATLSYTWYRVGETLPVGSGRNLSLHRQGSIIGDYYVKISNSDGSTLCPGSNESNRLTFNNQRFPGLVKNSYCMTENTLTSTPSKTISLYDEFYPKYDPTSGLEPYQVVFSTNAGVVSDADAANFVVPSNKELNLQFAVKEITGINSCHTGALSLYYLSMPPTKTISLCSSVTTYNLKSVFENPSYPAVYYYYYTYVDDGSMADASAIDVKRTVNVKTMVTGAGTCFTNTVVSFVLGATVTLPTVPMQERCAGADTNANRFDFNLIKTTLNPDNEYDLEFYTKATNLEIVPVASSLDTVPNLNLSGFFWTASRGDYIIYVKVIDRADPSCFSISNDVILRVYNKPKIIIPNPISLKNCVGNTVFNLTQNPDDLVDAEVTVTLEYYAPNGTLLSGSQISNYDEAVSGANPYIKVVYNPTCSDIVTFNLSYNPKPTALIPQIPICGETTFALQDFKDEVIANSSQYTFTDENGNPLPAAFDVSAGQLPNPVRFYLTNNATGCTSDLQMVTFYAGSPTALLKTETDYVLCDADFDGITTFNLDSKKSEFTADSTAQFEYFKDAGLSQAIPSAYTNETPFAQTVYVRITVPGYCPSIANFHLDVNTPTKSTTLLETYFICFGDSATIDAGTENISWQWSTGETGQTVSISEAGNYSVILTNAEGCSYTHNFVVSDENQPKIDVINQTNNSIEVVARGGVQPYRYYFNGVPQNSSVLLNPTEPYYEIQVESATGCLGPPKTVYFIKINNAFTPNGDGKNDIWKVENLDKMESVSLVIVDRWGSKVFESADKTKIEWDGKSGGRALPGSTYWYTLTWFDAVTQKTEQRQGWILLKNRN